MKCDVFTLLPAETAGIIFTHGLIFRFFAPQGQHVAPIKVKFDREVRSSLSNLTLISSGVWVYGPKTLQISNFTNIITTKERTPARFLQNL